MSRRAFRMPASNPFQRSVTRPVRRDAAGNRLAPRPVQWAARTLFAAGLLFGPVAIADYLTSYIPI